MATQTTGFTIKIKGVDTYLKDFDELNKAYKDNLKELKKLEAGTDEFYEQQKVVAELKNGVSEFNRELKKQAKEFENAAKGVSEYKKLEAETRKLKNESKELAAQLLKLQKAGKENTDEYKDLEKQYQETTEKAQEFDKTLKEIDETVGDSFRNVGNYKSAFTDAFEEAGGGIKDFGNKLSALAKNPILLLVTLLVGALKLLFDAFKKSETGSELMTKATGVLNGILSVLVRLTEGIAQKIAGLGEKIKSAFNDPKQALLDFKDLIVQNIQNRIQGVIDTFGALGRVVKSVFKGDWAEASKAAGDAAKSFAQGVTGASKESIEGLVDIVDETIKASVKLEMARKNAAKVEQGIVKEINRLNNAYQVQAQRAGDATLSLKEQGEAAKKAGEIQAQLANQNIKLAQNNLNLIRAEKKLRQENKESVSDLLSAETAALTELSNAQNEYTLALKENATERRLISRDAAERELDFLIDIADNQKTINERLIADTSLTYEQRVKILEQTVTMMDKSFKDQVAVIQSFSKQQVDINDLLNETDQKRLTEKVKALGVDDIIAGRLLEIIKERKTAEQDFAETSKALNQERIDDIIKTAEEEETIANQVSELKYKRGLITQEEYNQEVLQNELERLEKELQNAELKGNERIELENEIELKKLEIKEAAIEKDLENIDKKFDKEKEKVDKQYLSGELSAKEHEQKLKEISDEANAEKLDYLIESGNENLEVTKDFLDREVELHKEAEEEKTQKTKDEADKRREKQEEAVEVANRINNQLREITNNLYQAQINAAEGNEQRQLELQRKQFQANKAFTISQIIIDTSASIMATLAKGFTPVNIILSGLAAAQGAAQISNVASQAPPMAAGGFTGRGGAIDETGERTTGLYRLHEGEYVAPRSQVQSMPFLFQSLENNRRTGASVMTAQSTQSNNDTAIIKAIERMTTNIKVVADSEEIVRLGTQKQQIKKAKNL